MINSKHVHFYWVGPLLFGPLQCISLGGPDPPPPPRNQRAWSGSEAPSRWAIFLQYFEKK